MLLVTLHNTLKRATSFLSLSKIPGYVIIAFILFFAGPATSITLGLRFLLSLAVAPFIYEAVSAAITLSLVLVFRVLSTRFLNNERLLDYYITQDNDNRAIEVVNRIQSPDLLVSFGVKLLSSNCNRAVFDAIVARLTALNQLTHNDNQLLRASIYHGREEQFTALLNNETVKNNAHVNNNEALKEACIKGNDAFVTALLAIPGVAAIANHNGNEALNLANDHGHDGLVPLLLSNPQVNNAFGESPRNYSERRTPEFGVTLASAPAQTPRPAPVERRYSLRRWGYYFGGTQLNSEEEDTSLRNVSQRESSMAGYNQRQENAYEAMERQYQAQFNQKGRDAILNEIRCYLRTEYALNPARTYFGIALPFNVGIFNFLINNRGYYQHRAHTAYRYLFLRPNHWASFISHTHIPEEALDKISYMWLAATDKTRKLPREFSREDILKEFSQTLYELCRAHNYDREMPVLRSRRGPDGTEQTYWSNERYDDLEGDKPTCGGGTNQRIIQFNMVFLNEDPLTRPLTSDIAKTKFVQEMVNESPFAGAMHNKLKTLDAATLQQVYDAIEKKAVMIEDLTQEEEALIGRITFTPDEVDSIVTEFKNYYGEARIVQIHNDNLPGYARKTFNSYEQMIRSLAQEAYIEFGDHLMRSIDQLKEKLNATSNPAPVVFSAPTTCATTANLAPADDTPRSTPILATV